MAVGWGIPIVIVGCLLIFDRQNIMPTIKRNPNFQYGNAQAAVSLFVLVISFIGMSNILDQKKNIEIVINWQINLMNFSNRWMFGAASKIQKTR